MTRFVNIPVVLVLMLVGLAVAHALHGDTDLPDQFDFANGLFHRGFYEEAIDEYESFLSQMPDGPDASVAWLRLGRAAVAVERYEQALQAFEQAASKALTSAQKMEVRTSQGETLYLCGRYKEAIAVLMEVAGADSPPSVRGRALFYLGRTNREAEGLEAAVEAFNRLVKELPDHSLVPFANYHLGFTHLKTGAYEAAATAFSAAANALEADGALRMESRFRAAELYDMLGWTSAALGAYEQLRSDYPDSEYARRADYGYGWALYQSAQYEEAADAAIAFLDKYPKSEHVPGITYLLGSCRQQQKQYDVALRIFESLREDYGDSPFAGRALYKSAWTYHLKGEMFTARDLVRAFLDNQSDSGLMGEAVYLLGMIHTALGDYEEALKEFRFAATQFPESEFSADALFKSAECYAQLGLRDEAARTFEEFARQHPDNPLTEQAMLRSGDARFTAQEFEEALQNYTRILEAPGDPAIEEEILYRMAITHHNMKQYDESAQTFRRLVQSFPSGRYAAEAHFRIGEHELRQNEDALKAIESYEVALKAAPGRDIARRTVQGLALARYEQKDYQQAVAQIMQLLLEYPEAPPDAEALLWSAQWLFEEERWEEAATVFSALLDAYPDHDEQSVLYFMLGRCREHLDAPQDAIVAYRASLETETHVARMADIQFRLARLYEGLEDIEKARELYERTANLDGGEIAARARFHLAALHESQQQYEAAARNFMRLAILYVHETLSPEALWRAAACYQKMENEEQAQSILNELIQDYPDSSFAVKAREALAAMKSSVANPE